MLHVTGRLSGAQRLYSVHRGEAWYSTGVQAAGAGAGSRKALKCSGSGHWGHCGQLRAPDCDVTVTWCTSHVTRHAPSDPDLVTILTNVLMIARKSMQFNSIWFLSGARIFLYLLVKYLFKGFIFCIWDWSYFKGCRRVDRNVNFISAVNSIVISFSPSQRFFSRPFLHQINSNCSFTRTTLSNCFLPLEMRIPFASHSQ